MRVGFGYDSHRITEGRELILGGVKIPFENILEVTPKELIFKEFHRSLELVLCWQELFVIEMWLRMLM